MKTLGNILWHFPFFGFVSAIAVYLVGLLLTLTVFAAPIGLGLLEYSKFLFWPFGNSMAKNSDLNGTQNRIWKAYSTVVMALYFPLGLIFAAVGVVQVIGLSLTIIGLPAALVVAKSLSTYLNPVGKKCIPSSVRDEIERRKASAFLDKHTA